MTNSPALLRGTVGIVENLGELVMAYVNAGLAEPLIAKLPGTNLVAHGDQLGMIASPERLHPIDAEGRRLAA